MGVSKNRGTPKWMVKIMETPMNKWMIWGVIYPYFWFNTQYISIDCTSYCYLTRWTIFPRPLATGRIFRLDSRQRFHHLLSIEERHPRKKRTPGKLTCPLKINGWFRCISYWKFVPLKRCHSLVFGGVNLTPHAHNLILTYFNIINSPAWLRFLGWEPF